MEETKFTLFWLTGQAEIVIGYDIAHAINKHYSSGALRALDFYASGDQRENYIYENHNWISKDVYKQISDSNPTIK